MTLSKEQIKARVVYVGDRITLGVAISFILVIIMAIILNAGNITSDTAAPFFFILLIIGFTCWIAYIATNEEGYYRFRVMANSNFILIQIIWLSWTIGISGFLAPAFTWHNVFAASLLYLLMFITGYIFARIIWKNWEYMSSGVKIFAILGVILGLTLPFILIGMNIISSGNLVFGVYVIIYGIGSLICLFINYLTLALFFDPSGNDVLEDPPSMLIDIGLINTMIINFIIWILMVILIPLFGGGGGGGKKKKGGGGGSYKRGRSRRRYHRHYYGGYRRRRYILIGAAITEYPRESVNEYWEVAMGKKEKPIEIEESEIEEAKKGIIEVLYEEGIIPTFKDMQVAVKAPHLILDYALKQLFKENSVKYQSSYSHEFWSHGYCLAGKYAEDFKAKNDNYNVMFSSDYPEKVERFLEALKTKGPVGSKYSLWDLAEEVGLRPRWKISRTIELLKKQGKIYHQKTKPKGWKAK